jgi:hypothetical protein
MIAGYMARRQGTLKVSDVRTPDHFGANSVRKMTGWRRKRNAQIFF